MRTVVDLVGLELWIFVWRPIGHRNALGGVPQIALPERLEQRSDARVRLVGL
jgi:hypothetical protein